ncbi:MAG: carbon storage regulator [Alkaliphilus sp.]|nr:carbon storage regulator CsrA [Alkaliphilus sp. AH-315-G20]PHS35398.1 MAG: carbon storage regulator [Alkaliphilus sp.]
MLVLTRKKDESIIIDGNIEVVVLALEDGKVRIGINAPKEIEIYRKEIYIEIENQNKEAVVSKQNLAQDKLKNLFRKK